MKYPLDIRFSLTGLLSMHCVYWNFDWNFWESVIVLCFVIRYVIMSILELQSS